FWWRALYAHQWESPSELYSRESALWGRAATDDGGRSTVDVRIELEHVSGIDESTVQLHDTRDRKKTPGAYALWPARSPHAVRRTPGTRFRVTLVAPVDRDAEIRSTIRAWLLFGGYGGRTRRGLGSFGVIGDPTTWLPSKPTREAIAALFGRDILA